MSTRNGPHARANAFDKDGSTQKGRAAAPASGNSPSRYNRAEYAKMVALQEEVARADADYQRLRNAYMDVAHHEPTNEVALAMIGSDMDRAHARLQALIGLPPLAFTHEPSSIARREAQRHAASKP